MELEILKRVQIVKDTIKRAKKSEENEDKELLFRLALDELTSLQSFVEQHTFRQPREGEE